VRLERAEPALAADFDAPAIPGGCAAFGPADEEYTLRAVTPSLVLRFREEDFYDVLEDHFDVLRGILAALAEEREKVMNERRRRGLTASLALPGTELRGKSAV